MDTDARPSQTAFRVALRRAAHQVVDRPTVFDDPLAAAMAGTEATSKHISQDEHPASRSLRAFLAARSRYNEDELAKAVEAGIRQYVVLGAGLDTFAYRNPHAAAGLRVYEVDHPATQEWKRDRLRGAGIAIPPEAFFVGVDFERQTLADALQQAGLRLNEPAFYSWLGVVPYLTENAFAATLGFVSAMPPGSVVVFDYAIPRYSMNFAERLAFDALAARVAAAGEPFRLFLEPEELAGRLRGMGFREIEDLHVTEINFRYFRERADGLRVSGSSGHLVSARI